LTDPVNGKVLVPLQEYALKRIGQRFRIRVIARDGEFVVAGLAPRGDRGSDAAPSGLKLSGPKDPPAV
jgi:hypothetical protein